MDLKINFKILIVLKHYVKITHIEWLSYNLIRMVIEKPLGYNYAIGQAIEMGIDSPDFHYKLAPFTLTSLPREAYLELMIKVYSEHNGLTWALSKLEVRDQVVITEAWDSYKYQGNGTFIAGGSGITPFIPMIKELFEKNAIKNHSLIHANRKSKDMILVKELEKALDGSYFKILREEDAVGYDFGRIDKNYLRQRIVDFHQYFYLCGPEDFSESIKSDLINLGAQEDKIQIGY